jgi:hypothetical protein
MKFCRKRIGLYFSTSKNAKLETGKKKIPQHHLYYPT